MAPCDLRHPAQVAVGFGRRLPLRPSAKQTAARPTAGKIIRLIRNGPNTCATTGKRGVIGVLGHVRAIHIPPRMSADNGITKRSEDSSMTDLGTGWRAAGSCLSADPDLFFPIATGSAAMKQIEMARRICAGCPVRQQCLDWAMRMPETHGVWGGTTPEDRIRARRAHSTQRRRLAARSARSAGPIDWSNAPEIRAS